MAFQAVPDTASFRIIMSYATVNLIQNTIYVRNTAVGWPAVQLSGTATAIGNAWRDNMMPQLANTVILDRVDAKDEGSEFGAQTSIEYNTVGTLAGNALSPMVCQLVKLSGSAGAAPRQGRLFISPATEDVASNDVFTSTYRTNVLTALTAVDAAIAGAGAQAWVIVSRYLNKVKRPNAVTNTISARTARALVASQRDRRESIGA